ncbi:extracellular solute-binding protein [Streptomyces sp. NPDC006367]|uniref:ABC transporter substrate-binding protein n=1 Tax=unclassified Streptomyces TaxID=2593676 RepID=UPI00339E0CC5
MPGTSPSPASPSRRRLLAAATAVPLGAALAACGRAEPVDPPARPLSASDIAEALTEPAELTFWTWVPGIEKEVALFEKKHPAIKVRVVNAGQGATHYSKLRTALRAGRGAPDVVQIEYQAIPSFTITDSLLDLAPYGASRLGDTFTESAWGQVTGPGGEVWAIPQDTGPMGMLYRKDIFDRHRLRPPRTWAEFAETARVLHRADPGVQLTNVAPNETAAWHGLMWQAGARPYARSGRRGHITVNVDDRVSRELGAYWDGLVREGVIGTTPDFTDAWYAALDQGRYATWITAAWGPVFLSGSAKGTAGKWRAAPLPQWDASASVSGNWGGSTTAVTRTTRHPVAAARFAQFLNTDAASTRMFTTEQFFFPATKALLADPSFTGDAPDFYGGQHVNKVFADISATVDPAFQWPPFLDQVTTDWVETVGTSLADRSGTVPALARWQSRITAYARGQGFTVATATS